MKISQKQQIIFILVFVAGSAIVHGQAGSGSLNDYLPISQGKSWTYTVTFPGNVDVPYRPWFEEPSFLLGTSFTTGLGSWSAGTISFCVIVGTQLINKPDTSLWEIHICPIGLKFYFFMDDTSTTHCQWRITHSGTVHKLDLIAIMPVGTPNWRIARRLASIDTGGKAFLKKGFIRNGHRRSGGG